VNVKREFRKLTFARKLDVKRLQVTLSQTIHEARKNPPATPGTWRVESILIEGDRTTVVVSGNRTGLAAAAAALHEHTPNVHVSKASIKDVPLLRPALAAQSRSK
jgi:phosphoserine phosphatase